jgi:hypothetical protein
VHEDPVKPATEVEAAAMIPAFSDCSSTGRARSGHALKSTSRARERLGRRFWRRYVRART